MPCFQWKKLYSIGEMPKENQENFLSPNGELYRIGYKCQASIETPAKPPISLTIEIEQTSLGKPLFVATFEGGERGGERLTGLDPQSLSNKLMRQTCGKKGEG